MGRHARTTRRRLDDEENDYGFLLESHPCSAILRIGITVVKYNRMFRGLNVINNRLAC
jgi:hypothetical protein